MLDRLLRLLAHPTARWVVMAIHLLFLGALYLHQGILTDKEALKYIGCAQDLLHGDLSDLTGNYLKYGTYVLFLVPFVASGAPSFAVAVQILLGILAANALARWVQRLTDSPAMGTLAMAILLLCYPIQVWALAIYTEHFFTSITLLFLERVTRDERPDTWTYVFALVAILARPVGLLFVGPAFIWKLSRYSDTSTRNAVQVIGSISILAIAILIPGIEQAQLMPIAKGHVIAGGTTTADQTVALRCTNIAAAQFHLLEHGSIPDWIMLTLRRMASLFTLHRPWYSRAHNLFVAPFYTLYLLVLLGMTGQPNKDRSILIQIALTYTLFIGLTHDEWSGRFLAPLLPILIALAALGIKRSISGRLRQGA